MNIIASSFILPQAISVNQQLVFQTNEENWLKAAYQNLAIDYPKFYKMDDLSKLAILATEYLKKAQAFAGLNDKQLELIFANSNASQQTDLKFIESYTQQGNPSPSLFVYTLPNILTGELAIRNKWFGENTFYISPKFDTTLFAEQLLFSAKNGNKHCLCGWVESFIDEKNELNAMCFVFLTSLSETTSSIENIRQQIEDLLLFYQNKN